MQSTTRITLNQLDRGHGQENCRLREIAVSRSQHGVNIMEFCKQFNAKTQKGDGILTPVVITVYADHSFSFVVKTPPAAVLIMKELGLKGGSGVPNREKVGKITKEQVRKIAETKLPDLNTDNIESAMRTVAGTCRSMGVDIVD